MIFNYSIYLEKIGGKLIDLTLPLVIIDFSNKLKMVSLFYVQKIFHITVKRNTNKQCY